MKLFNTTQSKTTVRSIIVTATIIMAGLLPAAAQSSDYARSSNNNLPALIMSFSASMQNESVVLNWVMENQTSCKWFVIERSSNGCSYDSIAVVMGTNNTHESTYDYTDSRSNTGSNYYRLRQVDVDGSMKYSKIVAMSKNGTTFSKIKVYPNPAVATVNYTLDMPTASQVTVQVYNLAGAVVMSRQQAVSAGANSQSLAIGGLKNGNYFLRISAENGTQYAQSFVKML